MRALKLKDNFLNLFTLSFKNVVSILMSNVMIRFWSVLPYLKTTVMVSCFSWCFCFLSRGSVPVGHYQSC